MKKICIAIGEGTSERYFLPSLLKNKFGFKEVTEKHNFVFKKGAVIWIFPFPPSVVQNPTGGKCRFLRKQVYRDADIILENIKYLFNDEYSVHYFVFRDVDGMSEEKCSEVLGEYESVFKDSNVKSTTFRCILQKQEIEAWYIGGLHDEFPYIKDYKSEAFLRLLKCNPEDLADPKKELSDVLDESVLDQSIFISDHFGENMNIEFARSRCPSFDSFLKELENNELC